MKTKVLVFLCIAGVVIFGCKSPPKDDETAVQQQSVVQETVVPAVTEEKAVVQQEVAAVEPVKIVEDLTEKNTALLAEIDAARNAALAAGAGESCAETLAVLDEFAAAAKKDASASISDPAHTVRLSDVLLRYKALEQAAIAANAKERVDGLEFASYDRLSYTKGEAAFALLSAADVKNDNAQVLFDTASAGANAYGTVLFAGFSAEADGAKKNALESKAKADSIKAGTAAKDAYAAAGLFVKTGDENIANKLPEPAVTDYQKAQAAYEDVYEAVSVRRAAALAAIQKAEQKAEEVEAFAIEADALAPIEEEEGAVQ